MRRLTTTLFLALLVTALSATAAFADTAVISFTDAQGNADPVAGVGRTLTIAGNSATPKHFYIKYRATGGAPCAPSFDSDSGDPSLRTFSGDSTNADVNGDFAIKETGSWPQPGAVQFCMWLATSSSQSVTPISQVVMFRSPVGTLSVSVSPLQVQPGETVTVTIIGASESPKNVYATIRDGAGAICSSSYDADTGHGVLDDRSVNGSFSVSATTTKSTPGSYTICAWLADSSSSGTPIAGPQTAALTVLAPPPPCVVPAIPPGTDFNGLVAALGSAHCTLGRRSYTASRSFPRGTLIRLKTSSGTSLDSQAAVDAIISTGTPCRVPALRPGTRLSTAKARILAVGCAVGAVRKVRSRAHKAGIVLAYGPAPGTRLKPRASVSIVVSRGPGPRRR